MLELAILGVLKEQELHGYELKKRLTDALGAFSSVSFGSLYPALARLEAAGAVRAVTPVAQEAPAPAVPMTGSIAGEAAAFRARRAAYWCRYIEPICRTGVSDVGTGHPGCAEGAGAPRL